MQINIIILPRKIWRMHFAKNRPECRPTKKVRSAWV